MITSNHICHSKGNLQIYAYKARSVKPRSHFPSVPLFPKLIDQNFSTQCSRPRDLLLTKARFHNFKHLNASIFGTQLGASNFKGLEFGKD
ncbi:hypothetical protein CXB51_026071 [Gossypium anomalum]|uniref:Uncharacterized protein n=1 Tax=Gossypium anomalum TaxID=47600 RepID=A0A8J5Y2H5_9ROSI|nr:hypothetical protein CXB51_026071 [Gossypium anomalum]